jgi:hypothetical protein
MTELARWLEHVQKSKSHGDGFSNRILLTEWSYGKIICRNCHRVTKLV